MIRIRFHGRGGHGIRTAGRILGTAAFLAGHQVQDSPVYGAERRGAAVTAFTRIAESAILERGLIEWPDIIVVADETLLDDCGAAVLSGQESAVAVFVNAAASDGLRARYHIQPPLIAFDVTTLTRETLGKASALSAGLGAASARLTGLITAGQLAAAVREELSQLHAAHGLIEQNVEIATRVFESVKWRREVDFPREKPAASAVPLARPTTNGSTIGRTRSGPPDEVVSVPFDIPAVATSSILAPGNAVQRITGTWRVERPEIDRDVCSRCQLCVLECPDGAMSLDKEGFPVIDYDHCKGCMICAHLCPLQAIGQIQEVRAW